MSKYYILVGHVAVPTESIHIWSEFLNDPADRRVAEWHSPDKDIYISTVFLGLDHNYGDGPPLLFETMVFRNVSGKEEQERCSTWDEAVRQHEAMIEAIESELEEKALPVGQHIRMMEI